VPTEVRVALAIVDAKPPLSALADVTLRWSDGEITVRRCAVFAKSGQPPWATLPRLSIRKSGKKTYLPLIELPRDLGQRVLEAVLNEYVRKKDKR
jgi:hypothetical protein